MQITYEMKKKLTLNFLVQGILFLLEVADDFSRVLVIKCTRHSLKFWALYLKKL